MRIITWRHSTPASVTKPGERLDRGEIRGGFLGEEKPRLKDEQKSTRSPGREAPDHVEGAA